MMTFSEDDLLPYRRLRYVHTAEYFKTVFMQWTMLDATLQETGGFVTGIHPDTLSQMSVLDMSDSVSDSYYHSQDFAASFEQVVNGTDHESQQRAARRLELGPLLYNLFKAEIPGMAEMSAEVEKLIDEELKGATIPEAVRIKANVRSKAVALAGFRLKEKMGQRKSSNYNNGQSEFCIYLNRLNAGGDSRACTKLYFTFATPFHQFERVLQEQTMLCIIPPDVDQSLNPSGPTNGATPLASTQEPVTYAAHGTTWLKASLPPTRAGNGYTVKDGPWRCNIGSAKGYKQETYYISDEKSYWDFILKLQVYNKENPDREHSVAIMHSKERAIWDKLQEQKKEDRENYIQRHRKSVSDGGGEDEDTYGETYMEWLWRMNQT